MKNTGRKVEKETMGPLGSRAISIYAKSLKMAERINKLYLDFRRTKPPQGIDRREYKKLRQNMELFYLEMMTLAKAGQAQKVLSSFQTLMNSEDGRLLNWIFTSAGMPKLEESYKELKKIVEGES